MATTYPVHFAAQLRQHLRGLRKRRGLTQKNVAALIGVSQARIAEIEANPGLVSFEQLMQLLSALGVTLTLCESFSLSDTAVDESKPEVNTAIPRHQPKSPEVTDSSREDPTIEIMDAADLAWSALAEMNKSGAPNSAKIASDLLRGASSDQDLPRKARIAANLLLEMNSVSKALRKANIDPELLREANSISNMLRKASSDSDFLSQANSVSEILRKASIDADFLHKANSASGTLRKASIDADLLRKVNSASETLRKASIDNDLLRKAHEELNLLGSYRDLLDRAKKGGW